MVVDKQKDDSHVETQLFFDMLMMVLTSGRERIEKDWAKLVHEAKLASKATRSLLQSCLKRRRSIMIALSASKMQPGRRRVFKSHAFPNSQPLSEETTHKHFVRSLRERPCRAFPQANYFYLPRHDKDPIHLDTWITLVPAVPEMPNRISISTGSDTKDLL
ncbi:hypothetical protein Leryth_019913 [Lithospermum erythrorhizon]|nr:hypothetical protein Leryth_019913 [Lithospermum erythrorhizon]